MRKSVPIINNPWARKYSAAEFAALIEKHTGRVAGLAHRR